MEKELLEKQINKASFIYLASRYLGFISLQSVRAFSLLYFQDFRVLYHLYTT